MNKRSIATLASFSMCIAMLGFSGAANASPEISSRGEDSPPDSFITVSEYSDSPSVQADAGWPSWMKYGKFVLRAGLQQLERLIPMDGSTEIRANYILLVSPGISYNTGDYASEFYFSPNVQGGVSYIDMHGHRAIPVDVFSKMALILSNSRGTTVKTITANSNQYLIYDLKKSDPVGTWKAQFISTDKWKWQNYYFMSLGTRSRAATQGAIGSTLHYGQGDDNRVYYSSENSATVQRRSGEEGVLSVSQLNSQFLDIDGESVDDLKDYSIGDIVRIRDVARKVTYDPDLDRTGFSFDIQTVASDESEVQWWFDGDLTSRFAPGDTLMFNFEVVAVGQSTGRSFESLDFFETVFSSDDGASPSIDNYLVK